MTSRPPSEDELHLIELAVTKLRARVIAVSLGMICGTGLAVATIWLVIRGGVDVGAHLGLLRYYFPGYTVTWWGAAVGFLYGALSGGLVGWVFASVYNWVRSLRLVRRG